MMSIEYSSNILLSMNYSSDSKRNQSEEMDAIGDQDSNGPFGEIDDMLCGEEEDFSQNPALLAKMRELEQVCLKLSSTNKLLQQRVDELEIELECRNANQTAFTDQYSEMQCDFNDIEDIIKSYRNDLRQYQAGVEDDTAKKDQAIAELQKQVRELHENNFHLQDIVAGMEQTNQELLLEIQQLEKINRKTLSRQSPRFSKKQEQYSTESISDYYSEANGDFNNNVQNELERLIKKLMRELEHERSSKKKITDELKRSQREILSYEKEIMKKNNKIYHLEMRALKKESGLNSSRQLINGYEK